jgi:hypothetical protein
MAEDRIESHIRVFHEGCAGIVVGPFSDVKCAEVRSWD